jgi:hypothetical protein
LLVFEPNGKRKYKLSIPEENDNNYWVAIGAFSSTFAFG